MLQNILQAEKLSKKYSIPIEDIILIALNCCGINADIPEKRIRFKLKLNTYEELFYLAICVNTSKSPFSLRGDDLFFNGNQIGYITERENDTCDSTYFRRNKTVLTLNSNSRSKCRGCKFCGTYNQDAEDVNDLLTEDRLIKRIVEILEQNSLEDLSSFIDVSICTGCFDNEEDALDHVLMVRKVLKNFCFDKELKYIGSQITSEKSFETLRNIKPFSLYLTLECFTRRKELLRHHKANITIPEAKKILKSSIDKGFNTTILYILGLDPLEVVMKKFKELYSYMNRFPIINLFQNYLPEQEPLRIPEAKNIEYYLKARKELEKIFQNSNLKPRPWENYRPLWYLIFNNKEINDIRI
jgi:hypothetical protein